MSGAIVEPSAVVGGRGALVLARLLRGSLGRGLSLRQYVAEMRLSPEDQAAVLEAAAALEEAGEVWRLGRLARKARGNSATGGNDDGLRSGQAMSTDAAAAVLSLSPRRVRQLAAAGDLPAVRGPRGWMLDRRAVLSYREAAVQRVDVTPPSALSSLEEVR